MGVDAFFANHKPHIPYNILYTQNPTATTTAYNSYIGLMHQPDAVQGVKCKCEQEQGVCASF